MERAIVLLKNTDLSVEKISEMLGYATAENFYKSFKKYFHTSPREFLQRNQPDGLENF